MQTGGYGHRYLVPEFSNIYQSVMSTAHSQAAPELLAYLIFTLCASQDFEGVAWVTYDTAFRHQAAITGNWQQSSCTHGNSL